VSPSGLSLAEPRVCCLLGVKGGNLGWKAGEVRAQQWPRAKGRPMLRKEIREPTSVKLFPCKHGRANNENTERR